MAEPADILAALADFRTAQEAAVAGLRAELAAARAADRALREEVKAPKTVEELLKALHRTSLEDDTDDALGDEDKLENVRSMLVNIGEHMSLGLTIENAWGQRVAAPTAEQRSNYALSKQITAAVREALPKPKSGRGGKSFRGGRGRGGRGGRATGAATCARCARPGHTAENCFATTTAAGIRL